MTTKKIVLGKPNFYCNWNPYQTYEVTKRQMEEWITVNGSMVFYDGQTWHPKVTKIFGQLYHCKFIAA